MSHAILDPFWQFFIIFQAFLTWMLMDVHTFEADTRRALLKQSVSWTGLPTRGWGEGECWKDGLAVGSVV